MNTVKRILLLSLLLTLMTSCSFINKGESEEAEEELITAELEGEEDLTEPAEVTGDAEEGVEEGDSEIDDSFLMPAVMPHEWKQYFYADEYSIYARPLSIAGNLSWSEENGIQRVSDNEEGTLTLENFYNGANLRISPNTEIIVDGALIWKVTFDENYQITEAIPVTPANLEADIEFIEGELNLDSATRDMIGLLVSSTYYPSQDSSLKETEHNFMEWPAEELRELMLAGENVVNHVELNVRPSPIDEQDSVDLSFLTMSEIDHAPEIFCVEPTRVEDKLVLRNLGYTQESDGTRKQEYKYFGEVNQENFTTFRDDESTDENLIEVPQRKINHLERGGTTFGMEGAYVDSKGMGHAQQYLQDGSIIEFIFHPDCPTVVGIWFADPEVEGFTVVGAITEDGFINDLSLDLESLPVTNEMNFWVTLNYQIRSMYEPESQVKLERKRPAVTRGEESEEDSKSVEDPTIYHALAKRNVIVATGEFFNKYGKERFYYTGIEANKRDPDYVGDAILYQGLLSSPKIEELPPAVRIEEPPQAPEVTEQAPTPTEAPKEEKPKEPEEPKGESSSNLLVKTSLGEATVKFDSVDELSVNVKGSMRETYFVVDSDKYTPVEKTELKNQQKQGKAVVLIFTDEDGNKLTPAIPMSSEWYTFEESWLQKEDGQTLAYYKDVKPDVTNVWEFTLFAKKVGGDIPLQIEFFSDFNCTKSVGLADVPAPESDEEFSEYKVKARLSGVNDKTPVYMVYGGNKWKLN